VGHDHGCAGEHRRIAAGESSIIRHYKYSPSAGKKIRITVLNKPKVSKAKLWEKNSFAKVPLQKALAVAKATNGRQFLVWILLLYLAWRSESSVIPLPNGILARHGISRETKRRALLNLEAAGLIAVQRRNGRARRVRLT